MPSDRDASISDAAFREALHRYDVAVNLQAAQPTYGNRKAAHDARERVLALYAEREKDHLAALEQVALATSRMEQGRAERQGEEAAVMAIVPGAHYGPDLTIRLRVPADYKPGDRVRVVKEAK